MTTASDPRALRSREAIVSAARDLLLSQGPAAVTHVQVAERARVGRATVYRHWPRAADLLGEAMATVRMPFFDEPGAPLRDWIRGELTAIAAQLALDDVRAVTTTLANAALWDPRMDGRRAGFARTIADRLAAALDEAQARGELTLRVDSRSAAALALGPVYYRSTIDRADAEPALIEAAVDALGTWS